MRSNHRIALNANLQEGPLDRGLTSPTSRGSSSPGFRMTLPWMDGGGGEWT